MLRFIRKRWRKFLNLFRSNPPYNVDHPDIAHKIEVAFASGGATYYRFKQDYDMPVGRYKYVQQTIYEVDMRMTLEMLKGYIEKLKSEVGGKKGKVDLIEATKTLIKMESHANLAFNVDTVERLASVVYFDDTEILTTYDKKKGEEKISRWRLYECMDFFIQRPIVELLRLKNSSMQDLEAYVKWQKDVFSDLTSDTSAPSEENS
jgi:hypothetical protein